jgi:uncharacterized protein YyaL (SSP411 family)
LALLAAGPSEALRASPSPYLREAVSSPVHWRLWNSETLAEAKRNGKPLLVDVGAGWCHWCHAMDEGTYARPEIAELINRDFVPVKVDRDLSPDLDGRLQRDAQRLAGVGGWPLTVFLDPDGHVYSVASYVPGERMPALLAETAESWKQPSAQAMRVRELAAEELEVAPMAAGQPGLDLVRRLGDELVSELDRAHGGFGREGPKFPNGPAVQLASALADRVGGPGPLLDVATLTLDGMARGGVRDHVGGGFHRYSVDPSWNVPHFEKMLYVNAALLSAYIDGWRATQSEIYREVATETCEYLLSASGSDRKHGGFYASQDSDVGAGDDGTFYTWTTDELREVGGDEPVGLFVQPEPSRGRRYVLREVELQRHPEALIARLRAARETRRSPRVDETKYAGWNGLAIVAMLEAGTALRRPEATEAALRALDLFLSKPLGVHGLTAAGAVAGDPELRRLDDLAELGLAALAAFQATGRARHLEAGKQLAALADRELWDEHSGSYRESNAALRSAPGIEDSPTPAPEAAMALLLGRLARLTGEVSYGQRADRLLATFAGEAAGHGSYAATYGLALLERLAPGPQVAIVGRKGAEPLRTAAVAAWRPGKLVHSYSAGEKAPYPAGPHDAALAYVCGRSSCAPPTADPAHLASLIQSWDR